MLASFSTQHRVSICVFLILVLLRDMLMNIALSCVYPVMEAV